MMTPIDMMTLQFILPGAGFGAVGKKIMTKARVTKHRAKPLTTKPTGFENLRYAGGRGSGFMRRMNIVRIVEPYESRRPTRLMEMMLLKAMVEDK